MKKVLLAVLAVAAMLPTRAQYQLGDTTLSYIAVRGEAVREIMADEFDLAITIDERDSKGKISIEEQQRDMVAALKRLGIDTDKQLSVADLGSEFYKRDDAVAAAAYRLRLTTAADVTLAWQALNALGISKVDLVKMESSQLDAIKQELRAEAIRNAKANAEALAGAIGQRIGKCFYIQDRNRPSLENYERTLARYSRNNPIDVSFARATGSIPPVSAMEFKAMKLTYEVDARFVLE